eukprot:403342352
MSRIVTYRTMTFCRYIYFVCIFLLSINAQECFMPRQFPKFYGYQTPDPTTKPFTINDDSYFNVIAHVPQTTSGDFVFGGTIKGEAVLGRYVNQPYKYTVVWLHGYKSNLFKQLISVDSIAMQATTLQIAANIKVLTLDGDYQYFIALFKFDDGQFQFGAYLPGNIVLSPLLLNSQFIAFNADQEVIVISQLNEYDVRITKFKASLNGVLNTYGFSDASPTIKYQIRSVTANDGTYYVYLGGRRRSNSANQLLIANMEVRGSASNSGGKYLLNLNCPGSMGNCESLSVDMLESRYRSDVFGCLSSQFKEPTQDYHTIGFLFYDFATKDRQIVYHVASSTDIEYYCSGIHIRTNNNTMAMYYTEFNTNSKQIPGQNKLAFVFLSDDNTKQFDIYTLSSGSELYYNIKDTVQVIEPTELQISAITYADDISWQVSYTDIREDLLQNKDQAIVSPMTNIDMEVKNLDNSFDCLIGIPCDLNYGMLTLMGCDANLQFQLQLKFTQDPHNLFKPTYVGQTIQLPERINTIFTGTTAMFTDYSFTEYKVEFEIIYQIPNTQYLVTAFHWFIYKIWDECTYYAKTIYVDPKISDITYYFGDSPINIQLPIANTTLANCNNLQRMEVFINNQPNDQKIFEQKQILSDWYLYLHTTDISDAGIYNVTIFQSFTKINQGLVSNFTYSFLVKIELSSIQAGNSAPCFVTKLLNQTVKAGVKSEYELPKIKDSDGDKITIRGFYGPAILFTDDSQIGVLQFNPKTEFIGEYLILIRLTDNNSYKSLSNTYKFWLIVVDSGLNFTFGPISEEEEFAKSNIFIGDIRAQIKNIDYKGEMLILFSTDMSIPRNYSERMNQSLEIDLIQNQKQIRTNYSIVSFSKNKLKLQLSFENPQNISINEVS